MPGQRIASAAAALLATGSIIIGQPSPTQTAPPAPESFVEILTEPGVATDYPTATNCGCDTSEEV